MRKHGNQKETRRFTVGGQWAVVATVGEPYNACCVSSVHHTKQKAMAARKLIPKNSLRWQIVKCEVCFDAKMDAIRLRS